MKKFIALISLVLVCTLVLSACAFGGVKVKDYEKEVTQEEFVKQLKEKIDFTKENAFKENWTFETTSKATETETTEINGVKVEDVTKTSSNGTYKYNDEKGTASVTRKETYKMDFESEGMKGSSKGEDETLYAQDGNNLNTFDPVAKTYTSVEMGDKALYTTMLGRLQNAMGQYSAYAMRTVGENETLKFYIDDNVFTIVYTCDKTEEEGEGDAKVTTKVVQNYVSQIVVDDGKITCVCEDTRTETVTSKDKVETTETEGVSTLVLKTGKASVKAPKVDKYTKVEAKMDW